MSHISTSDIQKLADLSALYLSPDEVKAMQKDLTQILGYVEKLQSINTDGILPTYQVHDLETVTRADVPIDYAVTQAELLKNVPSHTAGAIRVPRVLE